MLIPSGIRLYAYLGTALLVAGLVAALLFTRATLAGARADHKAFVSAVETQTAKAQAADLAHARAVEAAQSETNRKVTHDYQTDLAALRARLDRLRASTNPGSGGAKSVSRLPEPPGGPDAAAASDPLPAELMFEAEANTLKLTALQAWVKAQEEIDR